MKCFSKGVIFSTLLINYEIVICTKNGQHLTRSYYLLLSFLVSRIQGFAYLPQKITNFLKLRISQKLLSYIFGNETAFIIVAICILHIFAK